MNQAIIVGRLNSITDDVIIMKVQRNYKNENGEYDVDYIPVKLSGSILDNTKKYCDIDDVVGIRGRLITINNNVVIQCEKLTFLSHTGTVLENEGGETNE